MTPKFGYSFTCHDMAAPGSKRRYITEIRSLPTSASIVMLFFWNATIHGLAAPLENAGAAPVLRLSRTAIRHVADFTSSEMDF